MRRFALFLALSLSTVAAPSAIEAQHLCEFAHMHAFVPGFETLGIEPSVTASLGDYADALRLEWAGSDGTERPWLVRAGDVDGALTHASLGPTDDPVSVPEPTSWLLLFTGVVGIIFVQRRRGTVTE